MKTIRMCRIVVSALATSILLVSCSNQNSLKPDYQAKIDSLASQVSILDESINKTESNKKLVTDFYQELFGDKNVEAIDKYLLESYIQHNPSLPDGREALKKGAEVWFKGAPKEKVDFQHIGAYGDLVYIHVRSNRGSKTFSIVDIFRVENGKIAEHWDVIQEVPAKSANDHPMF